MHKKSISLVAPFYNEESGVRPFFERVLRVLTSLLDRYEWSVPRKSWTSNKHENSATALIPESPNSSVLGQAGDSLLGSGAGCSSAGSKAGCESTTTTARAPTR